MGKENGRFNPNRTISKARHPDTPRTIAAPPRHRFRHPTHFIFAPHHLPSRISTVAETLLMPACAAQPITAAMCSHFTLRSPRMITS